MTATVDFIIDKATNVLMVPNAALRFHPLEDSAQSSGGRQRKEGDRMLKGQHGRDTLAMQRKSQFRKHDSDSSGGKRAKVWVLASDTPPQPVFLRAGITDGKMTEIKHSKDLREGMPVITGIKTPTKKRAKSISLLPQPGRFGRRR